MSDKAEFKLDIYTYPSLKGAPTDIRTSEHVTAAAAIAHLEAQTIPYAWGGLQRRSSEGWSPCDWDGEIIKDEQSWPLRFGTNQEHPALVAMRNDWERLIIITDEKHQNEGGSLGIVAAQVLKEHHPQIMGWAERLAQAVAKHRRTPPKDINFTVATRSYDANEWTDKSYAAYLRKHSMHYKAAASYAATVIRDPKNIRFSYEGKPCWGNLDCLHIGDVNGHQLGVTLIELEKYTCAVGYYPDLLGDNYPQAMYVITAMQNAIRDMQAWANEWLTPAQIEKELNLKRGVVRKYLHDHPELYEDGRARRADGRTVQIKRGVAINRWVQK